MGRAPLMLEQGPDWPRRYGRATMAASRVKSSGKIEGSDERIRLLLSECR